MSQNISLGKTQSIHPTTCILYHQNTEKTSKINMTLSGKSEFCKSASAVHVEPFLMFSPIFFYQLLLIALDNGTKILVWGKQQVFTLLDMNFC